MIINISESQNGKTVKEIIRSLGVSTKTLTALKNKEDGITLCGKRVTVRAVVKTSDVLELKLEDEPGDVNPNIVRAGIMPEILFENEALAVINKPSGMPTIPSHGHYDDSLASAVSRYYAEKGVPFVFRAVNRLDKDTSGAVLIAKNRYYSSILSGYMAKGLIKKKYICVICGTVPESGKIEGYISRTAESIITRRLSQDKTEGSDYSLTYFERISVAENSSAVAVFPVTGRTHQIRVHFSSIGAPLYGDGLYGSESELIGRQALHASELSFPDPISGKNITVNAGIPEDIKELARKLGLDLGEEKGEKI